MPTKADRTKQFIIEKVAPLFNKHGYAATSLFHITEATGLTKGAIYGNFTNKESLALAAYQFNSQNLINQLEKVIQAKTHPFEKLSAFTNFYKNYRQFTTPIGGCPILNIGVDALENNDALSDSVKETIKSLEKMVTKVLTNGIES